MRRDTTVTTATAAPARGYRLPGLRRCRVEASLTQEELARAAGLTRVTVTRLEGGLQRANPSTIRALAAALRVRPHQLRGVAADPGMPSLVQEGRH